MSSPDPKSRPEANKGYLRHAHLVFTVPGGLYLLMVLFLSIPFFQTQLVKSYFQHAVYQIKRNDSVLYMNHLRYPLFAKYDAPERYGLARELLIVSFTSLRTL
jgi:hypothetical protein